MISKKIFKYDEKTQLLIKGYINFRGEFFAESTMHIPKQFVPDVCDVLWPHSVEASLPDVTNQAIKITNQSVSLNS